LGVSATRLREADTDFTLSTLGNFSDLSFITRLDYTVTLLTHLRLDAFVAVRYGKTTGEFRLGLPDMEIGGVTLSRAPSVVDFGVSLRVAL
jgi:hypothetical protein